MKWILKTAFIALANVLVFMAVARIVAGFRLEGGFRQIFLAAVLFTLLNYILKPILKLLLGPIIILTLGLGLIVVNMAVLYVLDKLSPALTIENALALVYASLIIGIANFGLHIIFRK